MAKRLGIILALFLALAWGGGAQAYVFYSRDFGDWTVTCWSPDAARQNPDAIAGGKTCSLTAPPPKLQDAIPYRPGPTTVTIAETDRGAYSVALRIRRPLTRDLPVTLRIDGGNVAHMIANRFGDALLTGAPATDLVNALRRGRKLVIRSAPEGEDGPKESIDLRGFANALLTYRGLLRQHRILGPGS